MENKKRELSETKKKILAGLDIVSKRLIEAKKLNNGELIFLRNGVIQKVKATDL